MKRIISTSLAACAAMAMAVGLSTTATAAPTAATAVAEAPAQRTSTTTSPLLQLAGVLNVFQVSAFGGATYDAATGTLTSKVAGNPEASQRVNQMGGLVLTKADGNELEIKNIRYDIAAGEVTGVVTWTDPEGVETEYGRVLLYTAERIDETSTKLFTAPEGGAIMREFVNLFGLPADGAEFGTAVLN